MKIEEAVNTILLNNWDPIAINDEPNAQDEYISYAAQIAGMLYRGTTEEDLTKYLEYVVVELMGLKSIESESRAIAKMILKLPVK